MLQNKSQITKAIKKVAKALADLNDRCVYVGGAVTGFYADDPLAPAVRPTKDIDIVLEIASQLELEELRKTLAEKNIHVAREENVICRFRHQNILIDVMATIEVGWAPANKWFKPGLDKAEIHHLDNVKIKIMPLVYFLASKFAAFKDRGKDPRTSRDFEDIVYVLDNRSTIVDEFRKSGQDVRVFLLDEVNLIMHDPHLQEAIMAHLEPATSTERFKRILEKLNEIVR